jgi:hypothetical protein
VAENFPAALEADQVRFTGSSRDAGDVVDEIAGGFNIGRVGFPFELQKSGGAVSVVTPSVTDKISIF